MSCYDNIYSLCSSNNNPFSYRLAGLNNNTIIVTEKSTGREFQLSEMSTQSINPCDYTTEYQSVDHATCYQLYLQYVSSGSISQSAISAQVNDTISILNDTFNNISNNSIALSGNNNTALILSSSEENLIHLGNISTLTSLMYEQNQSGSIPPIVDSSGNIHQLNYQSLISMVEQYTNTTTSSYYTQQNIQQLLNQTNLDSVANCDICNQRTPRSFSIPTTIVPDFVVETLQQLDPNIPYCFNDNSCPPGYTCSNGICIKKRGCCVCVGQTLSHDCVSPCNGIFYPDYDNDGFCGCQPYTTIGGGPCNQLDPNQLADATAVCQTLGGYVYYDENYSCN